MLGLSAPSVQAIHSSFHVLKNQVQILLVKENKKSESLISFLILPFPFPKNQ